jgi:hypothetical protein
MLSAMVCDQHDRIAPGCQPKAILRLMLLELRGTTIRYPSRARPGHLWLIPPQDTPREVSSDATWLSSSDTEGLPTKLKKFRLLLYGDDMNTG